MTRDKLAQRIAGRIFAYLPRATAMEAKASHRLADRAAADIVAELEDIARWSRTNNAP